VRKNGVAVEIADQPGTFAGGGAVADARKQSNAGPEDRGAAEEIAP
jgi:hypothetical protein